MRYIYMLLIFLVLTGCEEGSNKVQYDGGKLLKEKCALCHNLKMPPSTYEDEKAPPMMTVVFHLKDFMKITMYDEKFSKFIPFVEDYVINPSQEKSYCDKESLKTYGVMPSQKGNVSKDELKAIASYIYDFYDQQEYLKQMQKKAVFDALPKGEQLARKNGCFNCHAFEKAGAGPSFKMISKRDTKEIIDTIQNGSHGKWEGFHVMMPAFKSRLTQDDLNVLQSWIKNSSAKKQTIQPKQKPEKPWRIKNDI